GAAVGVLLTSHNEGCGEDVLALDAASPEVGALARRKLRGKLYPVYPVARLRRHEPPAVPLANGSRCRQFHSALFSQVHNYLAYLRTILLLRYILVKEISTRAEDFSLDSNTLIGIYAVTYGVNYTENNQGLPLHALRPRVGAPQGHRRRAACLPQVQEPLLEQAPQTEEVQERMTGLRNSARARFDATWWRRPDSDGHLQFCGLLLCQLSYAPIAAASEMA